MERAISLRSATLVLVTVVTACSHPLEIEGEGDILSASGNRDCLLEDFLAGLENCTQNLVAQAYLEIYFAQPRPGWQFDRWVNYREDIPGNECSFDIPAAVVELFWGEAQKAGISRPGWLNLRGPLNRWKSHSLHGSNYGDTVTSRQYPYGLP